MMTQTKNHTATDYLLGDTLVRYVVMNETKKTFFLLIPQEKQQLIDETYETVNYDEGYPDHRDWFAGSLVHLHLSHHINSSYGNSYKFSQSTAMLQFSYQETKEDAETFVIQTYLIAEEGYGVCHCLTYYKGLEAFSVQTTFANHTGQPVMLELLSSVSLDNLSPFTDDDSSESLRFHTFKGGWSVEGKQMTQTLPQLNMEKSWGGSFESERIGSIGSKSVGRYFPYAVVEDSKVGCAWGVKLKHNATWQMELTRYGVKLSLSAGLGDLSFGGWMKQIEDGESFTAPEAYLAAAVGGVPEVSHRLLKLSERDAEQYGEVGMPLIYNEWCTTWGKPTHDGLLAIADILKESKVKYFVIDAGWFEDGNGEWKLKEGSFPYGMKAFAKEIRNRGMIPGVWMEFECVDKGSPRFDSSYDHLYLKKFGHPLIGTINNSYPEKFVDFGNPETMAYMEEKVIGFLKENEIGYLKIDYNTNIGLGCDGAESLGEGLRQHQEQVADFVRKIKQEVPGIIIENCASGGSRLDPLSVGITAMSSFSDAHESFEIPVVAANLQYLIPPRQSQVWCVLRDWFDPAHTEYICSAGFLGRLCWSGDMKTLASWQREKMAETERLYEMVSPIIQKGFSRIVRTRPDYNCRNLQGSQAVLRTSPDGKELLVVVHGFENPESMEIKLDNPRLQIAETLFDVCGVVEDGVLHLEVGAESGGVLYLTERGN